MPRNQYNHHSSTSNLPLGRSEDSHKLMISLPPNSPPGRSSAPHPALARSCCPHSFCNYSLSMGLPPSSILPVRFDFVILEEGWFFSIALFTR